MQGVYPVPNRRYYRGTMNLTAAKKRDTPVKQELKQATYLDQTPDVLVGISKA